MLTSVPSPTCPSLIHHFRRSQHHHPRRHVLEVFLPIIILLLPCIRTLLDPVTISVVTSASDSTGDNKFRERYSYRKNASDP